MQMKRKVEGMKSIQESGGGAKMHDGRKGRVM